MSSRFDAESLYRRQILPALEPLKVAQKKVQRYLLTSFLALGFIVFYLLQNSSALNFNFGAYSSFLVPIGIGVFVVARIIVNFVAKRYKSRFKTDVSSIVIKSFFPDSTYNPGKHVAEDVFRNSNLYSNYNRYNGEDHVKALIDGQRLEFSELNVRYKARKSDRNVFYGVFAAMTIDNTAGFRISLKPDYAERYLGRFLGRMGQSISLGKEDKLVELESPAFEKSFAIRSNDQVQARKFLTPSTMQKILLLKTKYKDELAFSVRSNMLYVAFHSKKNLFEPNIFGRVYSYKELQELCLLFELILDLGALTKDFVGKSSRSSV